MQLRLVPADVNLGFIARRKIFLALSAFAAAASVALLLTQGLAFGIDFKGGILIEVRTEGPADIAAMRPRIAALGLGDTGLQEFGRETDVLIRVQAQDGGEAAQQAAVAAVRGALGGDVEYRRTEFVGPTVSAELLRDGVFAVLAALAAMLAYIWFRFEWQFGVAAVTALFHDVLATVGVFSLIQHEFNLATVAAVLTIAGYSINDTVVVFDRVRENLRKYKTTPLDGVLNMSVNNTLARTVMTSVTTLLALIALYALGGEIVRDFAFAMIWGVLVGTYSSVCLAAPLLLYLNVDRGAGEAAAKAP